MCPFSVTIAIYRNDNPVHFRLALDSIVHQTLPPDEIVITQDGAVGVEMQALLEEYVNRYDFIRLVVLEQNMGAGEAHRIGVENCRYDWIGLMDADDIAVETRFEQQMRYIEQHPEIDALGGQIEEFMGVMENVVSKRSVPLGVTECAEYMKQRDALNQMTVMLRKRAVLEAGNYQTWYLNEDSYLWLRMLRNGCKFANLDSTLCYVRVGEDMYRRRGGWKYFKSELGLQRLRRQYGFISLPQYIRNVCVHFTVKVLMGNRMRAWFFRTFLRV